MSREFDDISIEVQNMKDVQEMFRKINMDVKEQAKIYYKLNRKAGLVVRNQLIMNAPQGDNTKKPKNKIVNNVVMSKSKDNSTGVLIGFKKRIYYVKFIEFGVSIMRKIKGSGRKGIYKGANRGTLPAQPFVERSHNEALPKVKEILFKDYLKNINSILKKETSAVNRKINKYTK